MGKFSARRHLLLFSFFVVFTPRFCSSAPADTMNRTGTVSYGETLLSAGGSFELGFFNPAGSTRRYLCIRSTKGQEKPIVWVANRQRPLNGSAGVLTFARDGNLVVLDQGGHTVWATAVAFNASGNRVAQLLDSGNLVVGDGDGRHLGRLLWQSFDEPGDTLLPGMKLLVNTRTGASRHLTSWSAADDPSPGRYSYRLEASKLPRLILLEGSTVKFTAGVWNGVRFSGGPFINANGIFNSTVVSSGDEVYYADRMIGSSSLLRLRVNPSGQVQRLVWREDGGTWETLWSAPGVCQSFALCGPYGACSDGGCRCLRGFHPKSPREWSLGKWADGCQRKTRLDCGGGDGFVPVTQMKLPELWNSTVDMGTSLEECRDRCAKDCSCTAYAGADVREGVRGCITWSGDLVDIRSSRRNGEVEIYLRLAAAELDQVASDSHRKSRRLAIVLSLSVIASAIVLLVLCCFLMKGKTIMDSTNRGKRMHHQNENINGEETELPLFDYETLTSATNNFSDSNKIGEGGFGVVYKGTLEGGQEIAVKRVLYSSARGLSELMNEVKLIVKLQHKNLVRLLGCCTRGDERMLIFEYMQNKSLDFFIFDERKRPLLSLGLRLDIILGIARGLLYLHHDSRFKIIHRDLKAGNILLDGAMNPKISDFGTARNFGIDQLTQRTKRVVGTYGYMSPEYAMNGIISIKSDVFSFGVIILEILSGIKSRVTCPGDSHVNLLSYAWKLWQEGNGLQLLDQMDANLCAETELLRCIQVALLCVQEQATDRPTMVAVVTMLSSVNVPLPQPKTPGFLVFKGSYSATEELNTNEMTNTSIIGR